jgi:hypothetical protein
VRYKPLFHKPNEFWDGSHVLVNTKEEILEHGVKKTVRAKRFFRSYPSVKESMLDHARFTSAPRYRNAMNASTPADQANKIADAGYASGSDYGYKIARLTPTVQKELLKQGFVGEDGRPVEGGPTGGSAISGALSVTENKKAKDDFRYLLEYIGRNDPGMKKFVPEIKPGNKNRPIDISISGEELDRMFNDAMADSESLRNKYKRVDGKRLFYLPDDEKPFDYLYAYGTKPDGNSELFTIKFSDFKEKGGNNWINIDNNKKAKAVIAAATEDKGTHYLTPHEADAIRLKNIPKTDNKTLVKLDHDKDYLYARDDEDNYYYIKYVNFKPSGNNDWQLINPNNAKAYNTLNKKGVNISSQEAEEIRKETIRPNPAPVSDVIVQGDEFVVDGIRYQSMPYIRAADIAKELLASAKADERCGNNKKNFDRTTSGKEWLMDNMYAGLPGRFGQPAHFTPEYAANIDGPPGSDTSPDAHWSSFFVNICSEDDPAYKKLRPYMGYINQQGYNNYKKTQEGEMVGEEAYVAFPLGTCPVSVGDHIFATKSSDYEGIKTTVRRQGRHGRIIIDVGTLKATAIGGNESGRVGKSSFTIDENNVPPPGQSFGSNQTYVCIFKRVKVLGAEEQSLSENRKRVLKFLDFIQKI